MSDTVETVRNPGSLRGALVRGEAMSAEIVSTRDLPDMGNEDLVVVLVKTNDGVYFADTVLAQGGKPSAGEIWNFMDDENGSFPTATKKEAKVEEVVAPEVEVTEEAAA